MNWIQQAAVDTATSIGVFSRERSNQSRVRRVRSRRWKTVCIVMVGLVWALDGPSETSAKTEGEFEIKVVDADSGQPIAATMYLRNSRGRSIPAGRLPFWKNHFSFQSQVVLKLRPDHYTFELERGPEYQVRSGGFEIRRGATDNQTVSLQRFVDMKQEGWWSGDLHIHRRPAEIPLLMLAQDLHVAPTITWWNQRRSWQGDSVPSADPVPVGTDRFYQLLAGEDERGGGALLYFNLRKPLDFPANTEREYPPMSRWLTIASDQPQAHIDIEKPFWWDMPIWVAMGKCHSIGLANNHMQRLGMLANEAWGKPRDTTLYPPPLGNGFWSQDIYYHLLNCGLRIPPSAGSASGVLDNPVGYNRVYVHCDGPFSYEKWWEGLRAGRVVVTNGPLLRPLVNGKYPGHVFRGPEGAPIKMNVQLNLALRDPVKYLEVVKNGKVVHEVRLEEYRQRRGKLPEVLFERSGWLLVRAVTSNADTLRFASTGPYYVQIGKQPRISRTSARFFVDWVDQRMAQFANLPPDQRLEILKQQRIAKAFWQDKLDRANDD